MSFLERLDRELAARHVPAETRHRIHDEYADHIASDPASEPRLGDPRVLARTFAGELAADNARRTALYAFLALALAAVALVAGQLLLGRGAGYPGFDTGTSVALSLTALFMILIAPQVALVVGLLAAVRALRRRGARQLPDAEVALIHRRCRVAIAAGLVTCAGLLLYVVNFTQRIAVWWLTIQGTLAVLAALALVAVALHARRASRLSPGIPGHASGVADDLPPLGTVLAHPVACATVATLAGLIGGTVLGSIAERSLIEGLERGTFEALVVAVFSAAAIAASRRLARGQAGNSSEPAPQG